MKIPSRTALLVSAAGSLTALSVYAPATQAAPNKNTPTETGCYDIVEGSFDFTRDLALQAATKTQTFTHPGDLQDPLEHPHTVNVNTWDRVFTDEVTAVVTATLGEGAVDCSDVTYRLRVFDEAHTLLADLVVPASGNTVRWETGFVYPPNADPEEPRAAYFSGTTETSTGRVVDTAPDDAAGLLVEIAKPPAKSSFS